MIATNPVFAQKWLIVLLVAIVGGGGLALLALLQGAIFSAFIISANAIIISATAMRKIQRQRQKLAHNPRADALLMPAHNDEQIQNLFIQAQAQFARYDHDGALKMVAELLQITPYNALVHYNRGVVLRDNDALDEAIQAFSDAIKYDSQLFEAYQQRAQVYAERKQWDNVLADCESALSIREDAHTLNLCGVALFALQRYDEAQTRYTQSITLDAHNADFYNNRAVVRQKLGNLAGALADFERAHALNPQLPALNQHLKQLRKQINAQ